MKNNKEYTFAQIVRFKLRIVFSIIIVLLTIGANYYFKWNIVIEVLVVLIVIEFIIILGITNFIYFLITGKNDEFRHTGIKNKIKKKEE